MPSLLSSMVCTRAEISTFSPTYPCTAAFCIDGRRPPQIICHSRVVGLPHDVTAQNAPISVPPGMAHDEPARLLSGVGKPGLTSVSVGHPGDGLTVGTGGRRGSPRNGAPDRARPDRPAVDRLAEQGDAGGAVTRPRHPGCGAAWLRPGPCLLYTSPSPRD